jgi:hypothetical protein
MPPSGLAAAAARACRVRQAGGKKKPRPDLSLLSPRGVFAVDRLRRPLGPGGRGESGRCSGSGSAGARKPSQACSSRPSGRGRNAPSAPPPPYSGGSAKESHLVPYPDLGGILSLAALPCQEIPQGKSPGKRPGGPGPAGSPQPWAPAGARKALPSGRESSSPMPPAPLPRPCHESRPRLRPCLSPGLRIFAPNGYPGFRPNLPCLPGLSRALPGSPGLSRAFPGSPGLSRAAPAPLRRLSGDLSRAGLNPISNRRELPRACGFHAGGPGKGQGGQGRPRSSQSETPVFIRPGGLPRRRAAAARPGAQALDKTGARTYHCVNGKRGRPDPGAPPGARREGGLPAPFPGPVPLAGTGPLTDPATASPGP